MPFSLANLAELQADLAELISFRESAKRARVQESLDAAIKDTRAALATAEASAAAPPAAAPAAAAAASPLVAPPAATPDMPLTASELVAAASLPSRAFVAIPSFGFDAGGYNHPWVSLYIDLPGVGEVKDFVECSYTADSFDLRVPGLGGKNYRLVKTNLEHDIEPGECKVIVKKDKLTVKLKKVKGEYSYESWQNLTSKKDKAAKAKASSDPQGSIMDMMKDMYDSGDANMKKIIGEAMMKSRSGEAADPTADPAM